MVYRRGPFLPHTGQREKKLAAGRKNVSYSAKRDQFLIQNPRAHSLRFLLLSHIKRSDTAPRGRPSDLKFRWLDICSHWWCPIDHVSSSESLTYPGITLLYASKLSRSLRTSNGTKLNLECFVFLLLVDMTSIRTYSTRYLV